jgi:hypothetical protein
MMVLSSIGNAVFTRVLGSEEQFVAAYLCMYSLRNYSVWNLCFAGLTRLFDVDKICNDDSSFTWSFRSYLGSSYVFIFNFTVALMTYYMPNAPMNILFIPIAFPASTLVSGAICLDIYGVYRGWQGFDHVAHLGGALAGFLYSFFGISYWNSKQRKIHEKRKTDK